MLKLIIADDEPIVREGLRNSIDWKQFGLDVIGCAEDGRLAYEIYKNNPADLILTDIRMPFINGIELTENIMKIDKSAIIILISAYDDFKYAQQAVKLGAFDYILKPVDLNSFKESIKKGVSKRIELIEKNSNIIPSLNSNDIKFYKAEYYKYPLKLEEELSKAIKKGDTNESLKILDDILSEIIKLKYSIDFVKRWGFELVALITRTLVEIGENADILFNNTDPWKQINKYNNEEEIFNWMRNIVEAICEYIKLNKLYRNKRFVKETIKIIENNYYKKDFTLNKISEKLYITPTYLSALFKEEIGYCFSDYLTMYRIEKSKELLKDFKMKIYEVSDAVGYTDPHYFSKVFKNIVGLTPKEYRETF